LRPEEAEVARWVGKAAQDRSAAQRLFTPDCAELAVVAFHCQQSVEKLLKGFLVSRVIEFEKVHDLRLLLDQCAQADPSFEALRDDAETLTIFAVTYRYPGPAEPARFTVEAAVQSMERAWTFVTAVLTTPEG